ncbi:DUF742 domain-containing protein [Goodfellowiella coeruleoviolacea]|uniref:DUF742 domain-containing protein n=1 Tax=Goodfellowiella coeruleoviolacea TaxID=334858 RepID=A0AAE3GLE9_9PSEU|nr:DUF742 domain-containing protein [Goodfellowiella coeruleoviolacea]MCP2170386.1 Protein of unknown function (DUF742) [Goodfellowiella coeruleoviolacea]
MNESESWFDEDAGPLVRPFALTRGRASVNRHDLNMITLVSATRSDTEAVALNRESVEIVRLCQGRLLSVAEIAAHLDVLLVVAKVLISDLIDEGFLTVHSVAPPPTNVPDMDLLQAVLDGVRNL